MRSIRRVNGVGLGYWLVTSGRVGAGVGLVLLLHLGTGELFRGSRNGLVSSHVGSGVMRVRVAQASEEDHDLVALYRREWGPLVRTAFVLVGSESAAEEIVQDAFVALQSTRSHVVNPGAYLRTSVVNACRSVHRHTDVVRKAAIRPSGPALDHYQELSDALCQLPWRQQAALVLRYHVDLPESEIALLLGCRPTTVRSIIKRGLDALRKEIEP
jgi:RNA polymerase sigma factor (sigma-70 family)